MARKIIALCVVFLGILSDVASQTDIYRVSHAIHIEENKDQLGSDDILTKGQARSKTHCANTCVSNEGCISFFYNKKTKECQTHGDGFNHVSSNMFPSDGFRHYRLTNRRLIGSNCTSPAACVVVNSECRTEGVCECKVGYSFHHGTHTCVHGCGTYGNTFQMFRNHYIEGETVFLQIDNTTPQQCAQLCISHTDFVCVTFETAPSLNKCYLQEKGYLDVSALSYKSSNFFDYYQRNCA